MRFGTINEWLTFTVISRLIPEVSRNCYKRYGAIIRLYIYSSGIL